MQTFFEDETERPDPQKGDLGGRPLPGSAADTNPISSQPRTPPTPPTQRTVTELLDRMRTGDRAAAAEFMEKYGFRVRRRIHGKLSPAMRRLFDSQEILSTLGRRLDIYVHSGQLRATSEEQLWSLMFTAADNALIDRKRAVDRLERAQGEDGPLAQAFLRKLKDAEQRESWGAELELERVLEALGDPTDRQILSLWLTDTPSHVAAELCGITPVNYRKRWERIKDQLRTAFGGE